MEQWYPQQSKIQVSQRPLDDYISPYEWNNCGSMQKQMWKDEYLESKLFEE